MRKWLLGLALLLCVGTASGHTDGMNERAAWKYACTQSGLSCQGIRMPVVVEADSIFSVAWVFQGASGVFFPGNKYVYVLKSRPDRAKFITTIHEMVHYLVDQRGLFIGNACANEELAFSTGDRAARRLGWDDLVRGTDWWRPYGGCQDYYGTEPKEVIEE